MKFLFKEVSMRRRLLGNTALVMVFLLILGVLLNDSWVRGSTFGQLSLLVDIRHQILNEYVEEPDQEKMLEAAVRAMVDSLDDPYTVYLTPEDLQPFERTVTGRFSGIGAEIDLYDDRLRIVTPLEDSPAWKAGVMAGDIVLEIDGESTEGIKLTDAVKRLTGEEGTQVTILVRHRSGEEVTLTITRAVIEVNMIRGFRRDADNHFNYWLDEAAGLGYIRITQFNANTSEDLIDALNKMGPQNIRGLILDLRFNPGGLLDEAVDVCNVFLPAGQRVVSTRGRRTAEKVLKTRKAATLAAEVPLVILINEGSASASEIVAGALADHGRAQIVGTRSFGKGSVQQVLELSGGQGALKVTNAYYYLPNGRNLHKREGAEVWGVDPSEGSYVAMTPEEIRAMIEARRDNDLLRETPDDAQTGTAPSPDWIRGTLKDKQLAAALEALHGVLATGEWPVVGRSVSDGIVNDTRRETLVRQIDLLKTRVSELEGELAGLTPDRVLDPAQAPAEKVDPQLLESQPMPAEPVMP